MLTQLSNITQSVLKSEPSFFGMPTRHLVSRPPQNKCVNDISDSLKKTTRTITESEKKEIILESLSYMGLVDNDTKEIKSELKEALGNIDYINNIVSNQKKIDHYLNEIFDIINDEIPILVKACDTLKNNADLTHNIARELKTSEGKKELTYAVIQSMLIDHIVETSQKNSEDRLAIYHALGHSENDDLINLLKKSFAGDDKDFMSGVKQYTVDLAYHLNNRGLPHTSISSDNVSLLLSTNVWMMTFPLTDQSTNNQKIGRKLSEVPVSTVEWNEKEVAITMGTKNNTQLYNEMYMIWNLGVVAQVLGDKWPIAVTKLLNKAVLKRLNQKEFMDPRLTALKLMINWYHNKKKHTSDDNANQVINPEMTAIIDKIALNNLENLDDLQGDATSPLFKSLNTLASTFETAKAGFDSFMEKVKISEEVLN